MKGIEKAVRVGWIAGIVMAAALPVQADNCNVDVYLRVGVSLPVPAFTQQRVSEMFREIGVDLRLHMGLPPRDADQTCGPPIVVQLDGSTGYTGPKEVLAYALPYREAGTCIHVFLDRIVHGDRELPFTGILLAHVIAHEITHVLEQSTQHSEEGVMKARWTYQDYHRMKSGPLPFASEDLERISAGLARRSHITHAGERRVLYAEARK